jgi:hypothetical protein
VPYLNVNYGAKTLSLMTFNTITISTTFNITALNKIMFSVTSISIMTFGITTLSIRTFCETTLMWKDTVVSTREKSRWI